MRMIRWRTRREQSAAADAAALWDVLTSHEEADRQWRLIPIWNHQQQWQQRQLQLCQWCKLTRCYPPRGL